MFLISAGRLLHGFGAADCKARSPSVGRHRALAGTNRIAFLGPVSRKPRKDFGPVKPFLDHL